MPFTFKANSLVTSEQLSRFIWSVDDATALPPPKTLTAQQVANIEFLVNGITAQFEKYIGYAIKIGSNTEVWDGAASDELVPRAMPIRSVTSIKIAASGDFSSASTIPSQNISFNDWAINLRWMRYPVGRGLIQVIYTAGYDEIPDDIALAAMLQFQWLYKKLGAGDGLVGMNGVTKGIGGGSESLTKDANIAKTGIITEAQAMLQGYQRIEAPLSIMYSRTS